MNKKGFTLIELLAVIVILAVIALIVTPIVTGIISQAKESANARSVEGHVKNMEYAMLEAAFKDGSGNTSAFNGTGKDYATLTGEFPTGVAIPSNDHIICDTYDVVEGTVTAARGCYDRGTDGQTDQWGGKVYNFSQGQNATLSASN